MSLLQVHFTEKMNLHTPALSFLHQEGVTAFLAWA
jgi:hypothetical protein